MAGSMFVLTGLTPGRRAATAKVVSVAMSVALIFGACSSAPASPTLPNGGTGAPSVGSSAPPSSTAASTAACLQGGNLRMASLDPVSSLSPINATGNGNEFTQIPIFDELVEQMPGKIDPQPGLAESWDVSPDGLTYTFHLRAAKFSNGDPVTADDVLFSMDQMIDPKIQLDWSFMMGNIKGFEILDSSTVRMNMKSIDASILFTLSLPAAGIYPKKVFEQLGAAAFAKAPVGSGPFMLSSWTPDQDIKLVRNPNYWGPKPYLDSVDFIYIPDPSARALKIESGEADFAESLSYDQIAEVNSHHGMSVVPERRMVGWYVTLNNAVKPLDEKVVRQALNYATPRDVINKVVMYGYGTPSNSMIVQNGRFWDASIPAYPYDLEKAKALMAQSSVPNGFNLEMTIDGDSTTTATATILQSEWAKIGVKVKITTLSVSTEYANLTKGTYQSDLEDPWTYTSDTPDDNEIASMFLDWSPAWHSFWSDYKSAEASRLAEAANATVDNSQRQALYSQLQKLGMDDSPWVTLLNAPGTNAVTDRVQGMHSVLVGWWRLEGVCFAS